MRQGSVRKALSRTEGARRKRGGQPSAGASARGCPDREQLRGVIDAAEDGVSDLADEPEVSALGVAPRSLAWAR